MANMGYMSTKDAHFTRGSGGLVSLKYQGKTYPKVDIHLAFPFSFPDQFISVREPEADEIGLIRDLSELDSPSQTAIKEEIQWRYYTPIISRIKSFKEEFGHAYWEVETNRGTQKIVTRRREQAVRTVTPTRVLIIDVSGNRFEIPDMGKLDQKSAQYIEMLL